MRSTKDGVANMWGECSDEYVGLLFEELVPGLHEGVFEIGGWLVGALLGASEFLYGECAVVFGVGFVVLRHL